MKQSIKQHLSDANFSQWLGIAIIITVIGVLVLFGRVEWPGLHVDAPIYTTAAINTARGYAWRYGAYTDRMLWNPQALLDHHGVLQVILYGQILKTRTWLSYGATTTALAIGTYLLMVFLLHRAITRSTSTPCLPLAALAGLLPTMLQLGVQGRPEHLLTPLLALPWLASELGASLRTCFWIAIPTTGLVMLTSPMVGLMVIGMLITLLLAMKPLRQALFLSLPLLAGSLLVAAGILALATPWNLVSWAKNMNAASKVWVLSFPLEGNLAQFKSQILGGSYPSLFWNWIIIFMVIVGVANLVANKKWLALGLFMAMGFYVSERSSDYNYAAFIPLAWLAFSDFRITRRLLPFQGLTPEAHRKMISVIAAIYFTWFTTYGIIATEIAWSGTDAQRARSLLSQQIAGFSSGEGRDAVAFKFMHTPSFVALGEPFEQRGTHYIESDGARSDQCPAAELTSFEKQFNVHTQYYIHPQHNSILFKAKRFSDPMPKDLCVGGIKFALIGGPYNHQDSKTWLADLLPSRLKHYYSYALYKRVNDQGS